MARGRDNRKETTEREQLSVSEVRKNFADLVNRVVYGGERIVITRHGKAIAEIVAAA